MLLNVGIVATAGASSFPSSTYAYDSFSRTRTDGWGSAEVGGAYRISGRAADYRVRDGAGHISLGAAGVARSAILSSVAKRDVEIKLRFELNRLPAAGAVLLYAVGRRNSAGEEYRARARIGRNGGIRLSASKLASGSEKSIGTVVTLGKRLSPGVSWTLRARFVSASPTRIRIRAWPTKSTEPSGWQFKSQDSKPSLQKAGSVGVRAYASSSSSGGPFKLAFDRYQVTAPGAEAVRTTKGYYVSPTGRDSDPGTLSAPWRTLQKAADTVPAGSTVYLRSGTHAPFVMRRSGTASAPIVFTAYGSDKPVVDGKKAVQYAIKIVGAKHVRVRGLTIRGGFAQGYAGAGITAENSSYIEIRNNDIVDNKAWGVRSYNSTHVTIAGNKVRKNAVGIHIGRAGNGTKVRNNRVHHNDKMMVNTSATKGDDAGGEGIALVMTTGTVRVTGNRIWANRAASYDYGYDGGAFSIYGASNWIIANNTTWDNLNVIETGTDSSKTPCNNGRFVRNINYGATTVDRTVGMILRCASNTLVANNTFHGTQHFVFDISHYKGGWGGSIAGLKIVNNIMSVGTGKVYGIETYPLPSSVVINYNLVHNSGSGYLATVLGIGGTTDLATFRAWTGREANGIQKAPRFVDPASRNYRLRTDSPAVDSGRHVAGVTDGFAGTAPDRGAIERR